jgi:hypothetical protein
MARLPIIDGIDLGGKPLTKETLENITEAAKRGKYTQREYFKFCLDNWDEVLALMKPHERAAMKALKRLMELAIK